MTFDPAWDMPKVNWQQQGSFEQGELALTFAPDEAPLVCIPPVNRHWLPYILGCLDQLTNPSTWIVADDTALDAVLDKAARLKQLVGSAGDCVLCPQIRLQDCVLQFSCDGGTTWTDVSGWQANFTSCVQTHAPVTGQPANPGGKTPDDLGCAIATFLTEQIIQAAIQKAVDDIIASRSLLQYGLDVILLLPGFYWSAIFVEAINVIYGAISGGTISNFEAALSDAALWVKVRCSIYLAIRADGHITVANFSQILVNLAAISYIHADVVSALHDYVQSLGFVGLAELSQPAGLTTGENCSSCLASWCYFWDGTTGNAPPWTLTGGPWEGTYGSYGYRSVFVSGSAQTLVMDLMFAATHIDSVELYWTSVVAAGGGSRNYSDSNGSTVTLDPAAGSHYRLITPNVTLSEIALRIDSNPAGSTDYNTLATIRIRGTGTNPFGASNC
jgi:hypothetical protein